MEESKLTPPCYNLALFLPISQLCSSLENQQLCNYGSCENQQPVSHRRDQKERGAPHKPCLWRTVTTCPMTTLWKALSSEIVFTWSDSKFSSVQFISVQSLSRVQLFATPWTAARQASLSITNSWSPPKPMSIELVMPSNHLILCQPLLLLPSIFPSIRVFSNESVLCIRWPKYWSFRFNISPSNEYLGLISLGWTAWISLQSKGLSRVFSITTVQKHQFFCTQLYLYPTLTSIHDHWKNHSFD